MKKFLIGLVVCSAASAGPFSDWQTSGHCRNAGVEILQNGNSLAILFTGFGPNMPLGEQGDGLLVRKTCRVRVRIQSPVGQYMESLRQLYSGGIIKSRGSKAHFTLRYSFGLIFRGPQTFGWGEGTEIGAGDEESIFTQTYEDTRLPVLCRNSVWYTADLTFVGQRREIQREYVIGGLDSVDADVQEVRLEPRFTACRGLINLGGLLSSFGR